jgi:hypothetical protein
MLEASGHTGPADTPASPAERLGPDHVAEALADGGVKPDDPLLVRHGLATDAATFVALVEQLDRLERRVPLFRHATVSAARLRQDKRIFVVVAPDLATAALRLAVLMRAIEVEAVATVAAGGAGFGPLLRALRSTLVPSPELVLLADVRAELASGGSHDRNREAAQAAVERVADGVARGARVLYGASNTLARERAEVLQRVERVLLVKLEVEPVAVDASRGSLSASQWENVRRLSGPELLTEGAAYVAIVRIEPGPQELR